MQQASPLSCRLHESLGTQSVNTYNATKSAKHTASLAGNTNAGFQEKILPLQAMRLAKSKEEIL